MCLSSLVSHLFTRLTVHNHFQTSINVFISDFFSKKRMISIHPYHSVHQLCIKIFMWLFLANVVLLKNVLEIKSRKNVFCSKSKIITIIRKMIVRISIMTEVIIITINVQSSAKYRYKMYDMVKNSTYIETFSFFLHSAVYEYDCYSKLTVNFLCV